MPFLTGQFTSTGSASNSVTPFQTIQREEVGTILKLTPNADGGEVLRITAGTGAGDISTASNGTQSKGIATSSGAIVVDIEEPSVSTVVTQHPDGSSQTVYQVCTYSGNLLP